MLEVQILLRDARTGEIRLIENAFILNDGTGTKSTGNYHVDIKKPPDQKDVGRGPYAQTWLRSRVLEHDRRTSAWELLRRGLNEAMDRAGRSREGDADDTRADLESLCVTLVSGLDGSSSPLSRGLCLDLIKAIRGRLESWKPSVSRSDARLVYDESAYKRAVAAVALAEELMAEEDRIRTASELAVDDHAPDPEWDPFG